MKRERRRTLLWQAKGMASRILGTALDGDVDISFFSVIVKWHAWRDIQPAIAAAGSSSTATQIAR